MAPPSASVIKTNIQAADSAVWSEADARPDGLDKFEGDLAAAIAAAWSDVEGAFAIPSVPVTGGASPPGGPLAGGVATLAPGMLTNTGSFNSIADKFSTSFPDGATEGVLAVVDAVAQAIGLNFTVWVAGYSAPLVAMGGSCMWLAPAPPALPAGAPGGWMGGSIQPAPLASGASAGDAGMTGASLAALMDAMAAGSVKQNQGQLQPALKSLVQAVADGFETTWNQWKASTMISGGQSSGLAAPPAGIVTGAVANPTIG
jgi:hypothetical protein